MNSFNIFKNFIKKNLFEPLFNKIQEPEPEPENPAEYESPIVYKPLISSKGIIVYKSAGNYIITLCIPSTTTIKTTLLRNNVVNENYAKYRTNCANVLEIKEKDTGELIQSIASDYDPNFIYKINTFLQSEYDDDIDNIHSTGIHFFKSYEAAFYYNRDCFFKTHGIKLIKRWLDDGRLDWQFYIELYPNQVIIEN